MEDTSARPVKKLSRRWRIARTALGIAIAVLLAEAALRLVWTPPSVLSTQPVERHELYSIGNIPGIRGRTVSMEFDLEFTHSAQGLRQRNVIGPEPPEGMTRRLLFLGDSFTYGHGVADDEAFVSRVAAALPGVEVANLGSSGHNTRCQLAVLDHFGAVFEPDLTVVVFFWNDLEENLERKRPAFSVQGGRLVRADGKDPYHPS